MKRDNTIKLGNNLGLYKEEDCIFPVICFKYWKLKIAILKDYPPYELWWENAIPKSSELKKGIEKKWNRKKKELIKKQKDTCLYCKKKLISPTLHHKKTKRRLKQIDKEFKKINALVFSGKISILSAFHKREKLIERYKRYYKSLKDTELVCKKCHTIIEGIVS